MMMSFFHLISREMKPRDHDSFHGYNNHKDHEIFWNNPKKGFLDERREQSYSEPKFNSSTEMEPRIVWII